MYDFKNDPRFKGLEPFHSRVWLSSPTMHGDEQRWVDDAIQTNWVSTVGANINEVEKMVSLEDKKLSENLDYNSIGGLRLEARQKLSMIKPMTVGQASRISGVSPADINVLLVYLEKEMRSK